MRADWDLAAATNPRKTWMTGEFLFTNVFLLTVNSCIRDDDDLRRGLNWSKRDDSRSPRRGRAGRGRIRREGGRRGSRGRGESLDKRGSVELRLDTSRDLLRHSPRDVEREERRARRDDAEDLAEDFSDFGDSDDDILNQEESDSRDGKNADSRPNSRLSQRDDKKDDLEGLDDSVDAVNESEENIKTNERVADALGADWSVLLKTDKTPVVSESNIKKHWSWSEVIRRQGLSKQLMGEDAFDKFMEELNLDLPEEEKVVLLDERPWAHVLKIRRNEEEKTLLTDYGAGARALSAGVDMNIRRKLCNIDGDDDGLPVSRVNTNMELWRKAKEMREEGRKEREAIKARVLARIETQRQQAQTAC